jgi:hypothetical protein
MQAHFSHTCKPRGRVPIQDEILTLNMFIQQNVFWKCINNAQFKISDMVCELSLAEKFVSVLNSVYT